MGKDLLSLALTLLKAGRKRPRLLLRSSRKAFLPPRKVLFLFGLLHNQSRNLSTLGERGPSVEISLSIRFDSISLVVVVVVVVVIFSRFKPRSRSKETQMQRQRVGQVLFDTNVVGLLHAIGAEEKGFSRLQWAILNEIPQIELKMMGTLIEPIHDMRLVLDLQPKSGVGMTLDMGLFSPEIILGSPPNIIRVQEQEKSLALYCKDGQMSVNGQRIPLALGIYLQLTPTTLTRDGPKSGTLSLRLEFSPTAPFHSRLEDSWIWMEAGAAFRSQSQHPWNHVCCLGSSLNGLESFFASGKGEGEEELLLRRIVLLALH